ncbi:hypothetical protein E2C01_011781 [Portunus trituberculatus]|uniref:Uncharacterized protein n=1 Tax=Portunus trituberculatus TaxID=210409 RepID=A0A5B7DCS2_PORTR|nr:hypothetical protein [Portunus trituberculatus]
MSGGVLYNLTGVRRELPRTKGCSRGVLSSTQSLMLSRASAASETYVRVETVKTLAINLTSIDAF